MTRQLLDLGPAKGAKIRSSQIATPSSPAAVSGALSVDARTITWQSQPAVADVVFVVDRRTSWGESNLLNVLARRDGPSDAERAAVRGALARQDERQNEDIDVWAETLGAKLASYND